MKRHTALLAFSPVLLATPASAQLLPPMTPITEVDAAVERYITSNGSVISRHGLTDVDRLIGRAVPCREGANAAYTLAPSAAYPLPTVTRYSAEAPAMGEPLTILSQGRINGQIGLGPVNASAEDDRLTRLDVAESVRLSVDTSDDTGPLSRETIRFLQQLSGTRPTGYNHWCIITSASIWNVRYESYSKMSLFSGLGQGLWIVTGSGRFRRDASAVVPYQVVTVGITPYPASWVLAQATSHGIARVPAPAPVPAPPPPPPPPPPPSQAVVATANLDEAVNESALAVGDEAALVAEAAVIQERLSSDPDFARDVEELQAQPQ